MLKWSSTFMSGSRSQDDVEGEAGVMEDNGQCPIVPPPCSLARGMKSAFPLCVARVCEALAGLEFRDMSSPPERAPRLHLRPSLVRPAEGSSPATGTELAQPQIPQDQVFVFSPTGRAAPDAIQGSAPAAEIEVEKVEEGSGELAQVDLHAPSATEEASTEQVFCATSASAPTGLFGGEYRDGARDPCLVLGTPRSGVSSPTIL